MSNFPYVHHEAFPDSTKITDQGKILQLLTASDDEYANDVSCFYNVHIVGQTELYAVFVTSFKLGRDQDSPNWARPIHGISRCGNNSPIKACPLWQLKT